jgi:hypothetical protein
MCNSANDEVKNVVRWVYFCKQVIIFDLVHFSTNYLIEQNGIMKST